MTTTVNTADTGSVAETTPTGTLTHDEIVEISQQVLAEHEKQVSPQGGYLAKKNFHLSALDNMPTLYPEELKVPYSAATLDRMGSGNDFEDYIAQRLLDEADPKSVVVIVEEKDANGERTEAGKSAKEEATWAAYLDPEVRFIFNARMAKRFAQLVSEHFGETINDPLRVSEPDAIELGPVMDNGLRAMRFVDVKWHKTANGTSAAKEYAASPIAKPFFGERVDPSVPQPESANAIDVSGTGGIYLPGVLNSDDWMQLAHYYRHARSLRLADAEHSLWGAVIGKEEVLVWARLDQAMFQRLDPKTGKQRKQSPLELYDRGFAYGIDVVTNALARDLDPTVPALTFPEWDGDVKDSQWREVCLTELKAFGHGGHISLLPGITPAKAKAYYAAGVHSIGDLARLTPLDEIDGVKDLTTPVYQARVQLTGQVALAPEQYLDLPRADLEVDFDYESDHVVYQRGVRVTNHTDRTVGVWGPGATVHCLDDFTGTEDGELAIYVAMWAYFEKVTAAAVAEGVSVQFYHYTHFEKTQDRRLAAKFAGQPGVPSVQDVEKFYDSETVTDLYYVLAKQLVWPTKSHSIKDLAVFAGFSWRDETPGGAESMVWYRAAIGDPDPKVRAENVARLRSYNGDDTHAQIHLRDWVAALDTAGALVPVETLPAPADSAADTAA